MNAVNFDDLQHHLELISTDHALRTSFRLSNPGLMNLLRLLIEDEEASQRVRLRECPELDGITALQLSIFDNWKERERGVRWGGNVKAWTAERVNFAKQPEWSANVSLWPHGEAVKRAKALQSPKLKNPISKATVGLIEDVVANWDAAHIGILKHVKAGDGTYYYDSHLIWAHIENGTASEARIVCPAGVMCFPAFAPTDADGKALKGRAIAQSRHSSRESMVGWATGEGAHL